VSELLLLVYVGGVALGLLGTDDGWRQRIVVSLCWPLGPLAFAVVIVGLSLAAILLWPVPLLLLGAALASIAYALG
jgi:hypothetical protein